VNRRILLIDADPGFRASLAEQLGRYRFDVAAEPDADRAFALAQAAPPALVMVAVEEPDKTGFKVFQRCKARWQRAIAGDLERAPSFAKHRAQGPRRRLPRQASLAA
jgi:DNA-binding response OmpR family regulator